MSEPEKQEYTVAAVIPAYNVEKYVARAIKSVLAQTRPPDEIIVVDDGSTDNTAQVVESFGDEVTLIRQQNSGASVARNTAVKAAKSQWIAFLDADDEWLPEKIATQIEHLKRNPDLVWSYTNYIIHPCDTEHPRYAFQAAQSEPLTRGREYYEDYLEAYARVGHLLTSSTIIKRYALAEAGYFRVGQLWAQDTDMFLRVAYRWPKIGYIEKPLVTYYAGLPGSITEKNRGRITQRCDLLERHLKLSAEWGRQGPFRQCAVQMLHHWVRTILRKEINIDFTEILDRFSDLLTKSLRREIQIRAKSPRLAHLAFTAYFKIKNSFRPSHATQNRRANIAVLTNTFPSLSETFVLDQITGLLRMGQNVTVLAWRRSDDPTTHADVQLYNLLEKTYYTPDPPGKKILCLLKALLITTANLPRYPATMTRFLRLFLTRQEKLSLRVLYMILELRRRKIDILQCHYGPNGDIGILIKRAIPELKLVTMFHGYDIRLAIKEGGDIYQRLFRHGDLFAANSQYTCDKLIEFGAYPEKTIIHPVGIDLTAFRPIEPADQTASAKTAIITVARLVEEKAIQYAIEAFAILLQNNPDKDLSYQIIGSGPCQAELIDLVSRLGLQEKVMFVGPADRQEVIAHLQKADIMLHSSIAETLGLVLIEAQAMQLPVVATDVGGVPQAVDNGNSAFLVPPRNPQALAEKLQILADDPELRRQMGRCGRRYAQKNYDIDALNSKLLHALQSLLTP